MSLNQYNPDDAPQVSVEGRAVALVRVRYYPKYSQTRHSPEEPAFIEVEGAMVETEDGEWIDAPDELLEKVNEDFGQEAWEAFAEFDETGSDYAMPNPDPYYDW